MNFDVTLQGLDEAQHKVAKQLPALANELADDCALKFAELIAEKAKQYAPVDSGELRDSIRAVLGRHKEDFGFARVTTDAPYWIYIEFGTVKAGAQPFVTPARESVAASAVPLAREYFGVPLEEALSE